MANKLYICNTNVAPGIHLTGFRVSICDDFLFFSGFIVSVHFGNCSKHCNSWCSDAVQSPYFRTAANNYFAGAAFNANGHCTVKKTRADGRRTAAALNYHRHLQLPMEHFC